MRFIKLNGVHYNSNEIESYYFTQSGDLVVYFKDNEQTRVPNADTRYYRELMEGGRHIVQVIPCHEPIYQVWKIEDDS